MDPRMMVIGGNIIGGYLMGQQQREARLEEQKFKQQQLKLMMDKAKIEDAKEQRLADKMAREQDALMKIFGPDLAPASGPSGEQPSSGTQYGSTFGADSSAATAPKPKSRLTDILSDPLKAAVAKKITGIDFLGALNAARQGAQADLDVLKYMRDATQGSYVDMPDGRGGVAKVWQPKFGGPGGRGMVGGYQPPKPELRLEEVEGRTMQTPINPYTQQPIGPSTVKDDVKPGSTDTAGKIALANQAMQHLDSIESKVIGENGEINRRVIFQAALPNGGLGAGRDLKAQFLDALDARQRAASGAALTEDETQRYFQMYFPSPLDSDKLIKDKMSRLRNFMGDYLKTLDPTGAGQRRMNANKNEVLPKAAVAKLKEGVNTRFGNGQVWTLVNGQPKRVE